MPNKSYAYLLHVEPKFLVFLKLTIPSLIKLSQHLQIKMADR